MASTWKGMTPEQKARDKADHKRRKYLRDIGRPSLVPSGPARLKVHTLYTVYSMSTRNIAQAVDLSQSTISELLRGHRPPSRGFSPIVKIPRTTHDKVMAYEPDPALYYPDARVDSTGSRRRLQALARRGFSTAQMASFMGSDNFNQVWRVMRGKQRHKDAPASYVQARTRDSIAEMYAKYATVDPADVGGTVFSIGRAERSARRHGFAPPECWDDDTIDDPDAAPEWTGACGTEEGYRIHVRETVFEGRPLPLCQACRDAVETVEYVEKVVFRYERFIELYKQSGLTPKQFTRRVFGVTDHKTLSRKVDTTYRWRDGSRTPRTRGLVQAIAGALECSLGDLVDLDAIERGVPVPAVKEGEFNQHVFRAAIDMSGLSYSEVAKLPGSKITAATVGKWLRGDYKPSDPGKVKPIADHFGVDVEVFYQ